MLSAMKDTLGIESPSKEGKAIGEFFDLGIINGLKALSGRVVQSAKTLSGFMIDTLSDALSGISNITDGIETDPVIRPVMDLSALERGADQINDMFIADQTVALSGAASASMDRSKESFLDAAIGKIQNALDKLGSERPEVINNITIVQQPGQSMDEFAQYVSRYIAREYETQKVVWGT